MQRLDDREYQSHLLSDGCPLPFIHTHPHRYEDIADARIADRNLEFLEGKWHGIGIGGGRLCSRCRKEKPRVEI